MTGGVFPAGGSVEPGRTGPTGTTICGFGATGTGTDVVVAGGSGFGGTGAVADVAAGGGGGAGGGGLGLGWPNAIDTTSVVAANPGAIKRAERRVPRRTRRTCFRLGKESGTIWIDVGGTERQKRSHGGRPWSSHALGLHLHCARFRPPSCTHLGNMTTTPIRITADVEVLDNATLMSLVGPNSEHLKLVTRTLGIESSLRGNVIRLVGAADTVALAERFLAEAADLLSNGVKFDPQDFVRSVQALRDDPAVSLRELFEDVVLVSTRRKPITAKTIAQRRYIQAIRTHDLTFGIGPAGTGKTYLAMAMAVFALIERRVKRIILTRPAVEAGERLGFLPGDLAEKVNPYLRPLYDALHDMMDADRVNGLITRGQIEVAPLAFMRGRTLNDCFVILDEAQNATSDQMRMFLTRLGFSSKAVVTGDVTQVDLPHGARSGLAEARDLLTGIEGIAICHFTDVDVVRHPLVQRIIVAYERRDADLAQKRKEQKEKRGESWVFSSETNTKESATIDDESKEGAS